MTKIKKSLNSKTEKHPWPRFPLRDNSATHLIIGSFPPNKFTINKKKLTKCDVDFFYGSRDNAFWELFINARGLKLKWPDDVKKLKLFIRKKKWVITDMVAKTQRKSDTALDSDLIIIKWNSETIEKILSKNPIKFIYFTSKWVSDKFHKNISKPFSENKKYKKVLLISPSRNGLRTVTRTNYRMKKNENATKFRQRDYKRVLSFKA